MRKNLSPTEFRKAILSWYKKYGRKDLPWQKNKTPYRVWVSEVMLQQTQVTTVIPYFDRFMKRFPSVRSLSKAEEDEVLHLWTGLGYYSRARNLHKTAKIISETLNGKFPQTVEELSALPGIGRSTAGAIMASAMNKRATILDGNVKRVLSRYCALQKNTNENDGIKILWEIAERYTPHKYLAEYTQALMDLGATKCTRTRPDCPSCPIKSSCTAFLTSATHIFPKTKKSAKKPTKQIKAIILLENNKILLEKRPPAGIWGGLWSFPECPIDNEAETWCKKNLGCHVDYLEDLTSFIHTFSHYHLHIHPIKLSCTKQLSKLQHAPHLAWYNLSKLPKIGLPAPIKKLLDQLVKRSEAT